jgi:hypothetical protein
MKWRLVSHMNGLTIDVDDQALAAPRPHTIFFAPRRENHRSRLQSSRSADTIDVLAGGKVIHHRAEAREPIKLERHG